jgi:hypothetical protein
MTELPSEIFQKWLHSFEEDTNELTVYRPKEYNFPLARGRAGIEFRQDGTFIDWIIGRGDARQRIMGHWKIESPGRVQVFFEEGRASRILDIVYCDSTILKWRRQPIPP